MIENNKHLPLKKYITQLQFEYLQCSLREFFYEKDKDKRYWAKTAAFKKDRVISLVEESNLEPFEPTIFDKSSNLLDQLKAELKVNEGFPAMTYGNSNQGDVIVKDRTYYFSLGKVFLSKADGLRTRFILESYDGSDRMSSLVKNVSFNGAPVPPEVKDIRTFLSREAVVRKVTDNTAWKTTLSDLIREDVLNEWR